jgi:hypothetical protein
LTRIHYGELRDDLIRIRDREQRRLDECTRNLNSDDLTIRQEARELSRDLARIIARMNRQIADLDAVAMQVAITGASEQSADG